MRDREKILDILLSAAETDKERVAVDKFAELLDGAKLKIIDRDTQMFDGIKFKRNRKGYYSSHLSAYGAIHRAVWAYYNGDIPAGYVVHHKDFNKDNNDISNLEIMTSSEHAKIHHAKTKNLTTVFSRDSYGNRISKFDKIYEDLKNKIEAQDYPFNTTIPSEYELADIYSCTRVTVRRALAELIKRGYIQAQQGKRVLVIYEPVVRNTFMIGGIESFKEAARRNNLSYETKVLKLEEVIADETLAAKTGFKVGDRLYDVRRVRYIDNKALILDKNYFRADIAQALTKEIAERSIYDYLENELKLKIVTSKRKMTAELATTEDKSCLELGDYNCLVIISGRVFNSDGIQFEYTESRHRPDYFCFEDTATRRKKIRM